MVKPYKFNRVHPPLMEDCGGDIYGLPAERLRNMIGTAAWTEDKDIVKMLELMQTTEFKLTRYIYWTLFIPPALFAEDITKKVTIISGVSESQKHSIESGLEAEAGASGFGLTTKVKASLKITDETTHEWHTEQKEEKEQTFKAGYRYCTWVLADELILKKTTQMRMPKLTAPRVVFPPAVATCILLTYQDKWKDPRSREGLAKVLTLQAARGKHKGTPITLPTGKLAL